jgi:glycosidase
MPTKAEILSSPRPDSIWGAPWPELAPGEEYFPSPVSWQSECLYQIVVDRFSDGNEANRQILQTDQRPVRPLDWNWQRWADSGYQRFQGGTLRGATSKLDYLQNLGATAVWLSPVWKQRDWSDDYHGYALMDFLNVDRRFGTRADLVEFVEQAHQRGIRVIADILINHTGANWLYDINGQLVDQPQPYLANGRYPFGAWLDGNGKPMAVGAPITPADAAWPSEMQDSNAYSRRGYTDFSRGEDEDDNAEFRHGDWFNRDLALDAVTTDGHRVLDTIIRIWCYWIEFADLDGFRCDTMKHVRRDEAQLFCKAIHEFATSIGKENFLIFGEVAGRLRLEESYLELLGRDLDAVSEVDGPRAAMRVIAAGGGGQISEFFADYQRWEGTPAATHRKAGSAFQRNIHDHDTLWTDQKLRFGAEASDPRQCIVGSAFVLYLLGLPCLYYGEEQAMVGPEAEELQWLRNESYGKGPSSDRYLREAMFGPEHPRRSGRAEGFDETMPGFGPRGTTGMHLFDEDSVPYRKVRHLLAVRSEHPALQSGRQYLRQLRRAPNNFDFPQPGEVLAWSRILARREVLVVVNPSLDETRSAAVLVDAAINQDGAQFRVLGNSALLDGPQKHEVDDQLVVGTDGNGCRYLELSDLPPASVLVLGN